MDNGREPLMPVQFGALQGVRILSTGSIIAEPYAAAMAAEMGAEVIQVERPGAGDYVWRNLEFLMECENGESIAAGWVQDRRNTHHITLDLSKPEGRDILLKFIAQSDIWMESSIPGAYDGWGLDDETVEMAAGVVLEAAVEGT